jgi:hypothetical protein
VQKEVSPAVMWSVVAVFALIVLAVGFRFFTRNPGQLTQEEEAKAKATIQQQYQGYFGGQGPGGRR